MTPTRNHYFSRLLKLLLSFAGFGLASVSSAETVLLYENDFESPNQAISLSCYAIDGTPINTMYGESGIFFQQIASVETIHITATGGSPNYSDATGSGGNYGISMLNGDRYGDRLSLTFDSQNLGFINVGMDISSIDVQGCGGPFFRALVEAPRFVISLLDSPGGVFGWGNSVLDSVEVTGNSSDQWTFDWTRHVIPLDASGSTDGIVSVVWKLEQSGYGAFDNMVITASTDPGNLGEDKMCVYQEETTGQGDFALLGEAGIHNRNGETASEIYAYGGGNDSYNGSSPPAISNISQLVPWLSSEGLVLGVIHDSINDGSGGNATLDFTLTGDNASYLVEDDPGEVGVWTWSSCCTDGGVYGSLDGDWSLAISASSLAGITSWQVTGSDAAIQLDPTKSVKLELCPSGEEQEPLVKMLIDGPDRDSDQEIDSIIEVKQGATTDYIWQISYNGEEGPTVLIEDHVPAESIVGSVNGDDTGLPLECGGSTAFTDESGETGLSRGGKLGKNCRSSTSLSWSPDSEEEVLMVGISMRESPGKGHKSPAFAPTSCGALYLNEGAVAWEIDPSTGEPARDSGTGELLPPLYESNSLCLAAVKNPTAFGADADNDGDGLYDVDEACHNEVMTDPCSSDTDGDGFSDSEDNCPVNYNPSQADDDGDEIGDACDPDFES